MDKHHITTAAAMALCAGAAWAQGIGPYEGGDASNAYRVVPPSAAGAMLDRAAVAAEGRAAARQVDSRAGYQSDAERTYSAAPRAGVLSRAQVREATAEMGGPPPRQTFEGGDAAPH
jgi:hypothetical protein